MAECGGPPLTVRLGSASSPTTTPPLAFPSNSEHANNNDTTNVSGFPIAAPPAAATGALATGSGAATAAAAASSKETPWSDPDEEHRSTRFPLLLIPQEFTHLQMVFQSKHT